MHNFKIGVKIVSFLSILSVLIAFCNDLVAEPTYTRLMLHEMYDREKNYSLAVLGASHVYLSFDPMVFDERLEECNFMNLGSSAQSLTGSYFLLKEFLKSNTPDLVMMEITYASYENVYERTSVPEYALFDYMKPSLNKLQYFFSAFPKEDYANALFPAYRNRNMLELSKAGEKYYQKREEGYYDYKGFGHAEGWQYVCKGFVSVDWSYENMDFERAEPFPWDESLILEENVEYLNNITDLCMSKNIDVVWITAPIPVYSMMQMGNYEEVHNYFEMLAKKCGVEYYDFNYCHKDILERNDYVYFYDSNHMNEVYAEIFSNAVCQVLEERNEGTMKYEKYFYKTYDDMIRECQSASLNMIVSH